MNFDMKNRIVSILAWAQILPAAALFAASPADWPQWRGPTRDGKSPDTGLLQQWPEGGPKLLWKATGLGGGYSSVAVVGERIYTEGDAGENSAVVALSRADGKKLWSSRLGKGGAPGWGGFAGPRATPSVEGDRVFAVGQFGEVACYDAGSGEELWRKSYEADFGATRPEWGFSGSPLLDGGHVLVAPGGAAGSVAALDPRTGALQWRTADFKDGVHYTSLTPADIGGQHQYLFLSDASLAGIAPDGKVLWRTARKGATAVIPDPIYSDGRLFTTSGYGTGGNLFSIAAQAGRYTVEETAKLKPFETHIGGTVLVDGRVYGHSEKGGWTCLDLKSGKILWQEKAKFGKGSIVYAGGRLILREEDNKGSRKGRVALIEPSAEGWRERGMFAQPDRTETHAWAHPVVIGGRLYLRDGDVLLCYDLKAS